MNNKKIKTFFKLHWIKLIVVFSALAIIGSLVAFVAMGLREWGTVDAVSKQPCKLLHKRPRNLPLSHHRQSNCVA